MNCTRAAIVAATVLAGTAVACGPHQATDAILCAQNPATGRVFATIDGAPHCGPGPVTVVDLPCGPLTIRTDDTCVRAHIVGDGTSTGIRGDVIVPNWYPNPALGDSVYGEVV